MRIECFFRSALDISGLTEIAVGSFLLLAKILDISATRTNLTRMGLGQDASLKYLPNL